MQSLMHLCHGVRLKNLQLTDLLVKNAMIFGGSALVVEFLAPDLQRFEVQPGFHIDSTNNATDETKHKIH